MKISNKIGILVFAYNRPSHLRRVLIALEDYKINKINLILDGPKNKKDYICQKEIKSIVFGKTTIDINFIQRTKNFGLAKSITLALDSFSKIYENLIIIEDDCIPRKEFFRFMTNCIKRFNKDNSIGAICGYQFPKIQTEDNLELKIYKLDNFIPWGWSTKSIDWINYRKKNQKFFNKKNLLKIKSKIILNLLKSKTNKKNIWSLKFMIYNNLLNKKYIFPNKSLIKNIGFDGSGVNSKITDKFSAKYYPSKKMVISKIIHNKRILKKHEKELIQNIGFYY